MNINSNEIGIWEHQYPEQVAIIRGIASPGEAIPQYAIWAAFKGMITEDDITWARDFIKGNKGINNAD